MGMKFQRAYFTQRDNAGHILYVQSNTVIGIIRKLNFSPSFILQNTYFGYPIGNR